MSNPDADCMLSQLRDSCFRSPGYQFRHVIGIKLCLGKFSGFVLRNIRQCLEYKKGETFAQRSGRSVPNISIYFCISSCLISFMQLLTLDQGPLALTAAIEDTSIDFGDFFKGPLPGKFLKLLGYLALSRLGIYIPLGGVNREAFAGNFDQNSLLSTLDSFSGGGIGRLGICSLGIVPFINASIVFQLLTQIYPKLQELQKREGEAGRKKILQYTRYASVGFAIVQVWNLIFSCQPVH